MFEKEAEERARKLEESQILGVYDNDEDLARDIAWDEGKVAGYEEGFKDGAEFGYNKANEWHKPSEKLPEECSLVLAYLFEETEPTICKYVVSNQWECLPKRIVFCSNDQVRKWKEITPPKEVKEND